MQAAGLLNLENGLDLIGIALALVIIVYLCRNRRKYNRLLPLSSHTANFQQTVFLEWFNQRSQAALNAIAEAVAVEQRQLQQWLNSADAGRSNGSRELSTAAGRQPSRHITLTDDSLDQESGRSEYARIDDLAQAGLTIEQMAEQSNLPIDEIQLYLGARRHQVGN